MNKVKKDYIKIAYAKGDALYVPVTQLDLVSKYIGPGDNANVKVNRLGGGEWKRQRQKCANPLRIWQRSLLRSTQSE